MNSALWKRLRPSIAAPLSIGSGRILKAAGCLVMGMVLGGCSVQPLQDEDGAASASDTPVSVTLRPHWPGPLTSLDSAAIGVNRSRVTPYPGEPETGEGVTAYGAGLRPPADASADRSGDDDDEDEDDLSMPGTLVDKGMASWYGGQFHGRLTASGERFDRGELTAAHRSLPFGSRVCVRNVSTGKIVMVRINDRGPFVSGRVIDLSQAAARELGIQGLGIKPVELWKLESQNDNCPDELLSAAGSASPGSVEVPSDAVRNVSAKPAAQARKPSSGKKPASRPTAAGKSGKTGKKSPAQPKTRGSKSS